jgi:hypothetical protein
VLPPPAVERLFFIKPSKYTADGNLVLVQRFTDHDAPIAIARKALACGAAVPMSDPRRRELRGTWPGHPDPARCESLDDAAATSDEPPSNIAPVRHSAFDPQPFDRGAPFTMKVPREVAS